MVHSKHRLLIIQSPKENPYDFQIHQIQEEKKIDIDGHDGPTDWNECNFFYVNPKVIQ